MDKVDVYAYATVYVDGSPLTFQSFQDTEIAQVLKTRDAKPSSIMASALIDLPARPYIHHVVATIQIFDNGDLAPPFSL